MQFKSNDAVMLGALSVCSVDSSSALTALRHATDTMQEAYEWKAQCEEAGQWADYSWNAVYYGAVALLYSMHPDDHRWANAIFRITDAAHVTQKSP